MTDPHTTSHIPDEAAQAAEAQFTEYFIKNYPKDCIIYNPAWHAPKIFRAAKAAITENLPQHLSAPCAVTKPVDVASWAQDLLTAWDQWYSSRQRDDAAKVLSEKLILAACFAGTAYDAAMSAPFFQDNAPEFLLRIFLIALIDQNSPELDPYRAKNNPQAASHADDTKPVDVADTDGSMTAEEIRLENLKQMAMYHGAIVSFECREPYYLASCDHCGWVGSSELCGTDSFGDDSDVYCPRCHSSGADCGSVAERINCQPVDVAALLNSAALIIEGRSTAINSDFIQKLSKRNPTEIASLVSYHDMELGAAIRALSAEPAHGEQCKPLPAAPTTEAGK